MARIALGLEYDGTGFVGWQVQRTGRSIQDTIAQAVSVVANETVSILGAGRTDAGVHAACQVAHFDTSAVRTKREWILGINSKLPDDIVVHWANEVDGEFDAADGAIRALGIILQIDSITGVHRKFDGAGVALHNSGMVGGVGEPAKGIPQLACVVADVRSSGYNISHSTTIGSA